MRLEEIDKELESPRIFLVRHGESTWDAVGLVRGQSDVPQLTPLGIRQSWQSARGLAGARVGALFSSDLRRASATAQAFGQVLGLPVVTDARLRGRALGIVEGTPSVLLSPDRSGVDGWRVVDADVAPDGGESIRELYTRASEFVRQLLVLPTVGDIVIVSHSGVVRVIAAFIDGTAPESMQWAPVGTGGMLSRVLYRPVPEVPRRRPVAVRDRVSGARATVAHHRQVNVDDGGGGQRLVG